MSENSLKTTILEALRHADENGYAFEGMTPEAIAVDMLDCDAEVFELASGIAYATDQKRIDIVATIICEARP